MTSSRLEWSASLEVFGVDTTAGGTALSHGVPPGNQALDHPDGRRKFHGHVGVATALSG